MPLLQLLNTEQQKKFDNSPILTAKQREKYFAYDERIIEHIDKMKNTENQVGFLVQLGYFRASGKFFNNSHFKTTDVKYCCDVLEIDTDDFQQLISSYGYKARASHKKYILNYCGWTAFSAKQRQELLNELSKHAKQQLHPKELLPIATKYLINRKIELPTYYVVSEIITELYNIIEDQYLDVIDKVLLVQHKKILDDLIWIDDKRKKHYKYSALSKIKGLSFSTKIKDIEDSILNYKLLKAFYEEFAPIYSKLQLSESATTYYSEWVVRSKLFQLKQFKNRSKAYLYLLAHVKHQYHMQTDLYIDIINKLVSNANNTANKKINIHTASVAKQQSKILKLLANSHLDSKQAFKTILDILNDSNRNHSQKDLAIREIAIQHLYCSDSKEDIDVDIEKYLTDTNSSSDLKFKLLSKIGSSLQRKVTPIICELSFEHLKPNSKLSSAISNFVEEQGKPKRENVKVFLSTSEIEQVTNNGKINLFAYKGMLFTKLLSSIKSGDTAVKHSYNYLHIDNYLIPENMWELESDLILQSCGLQQFKNIDNILSIYEELISEKFHQINKDYLNGSNKYLKVPKSGRLIIRTDGSNNQQKRNKLAPILSQDGIVQISNILDDINNITKFTKCLKHHSIKNAKMNSDDKTIYAGIISKGCNHGLTKMANISKGISKNKLDNTINWCFSIENIEQANSKVIGNINKLALPNVYRSCENKSHTSSDGQKFNVGVDSILANYSFKYFGQSQGISVYTFIDDRHVLFYDTILSPGEREAAYVIDGLMSNNVSNSHIHSTDTHGYSEVIFAAMHFLGVSFAPRIKKVGAQRLYCIDSKRNYSKTNFKIKPDAKINTKLIKDNWNDILKLIATIKSKTTTASQIFKRMNSYSKELPLYKALKEFGRIIKTVFILTYIDDHILRKQIDKQLNKIESSNKFAKAIFFANSQEFRTGSGAEQKLIVACKTLIQNCIVLWNYLYLSQILVNMDSKSKASLLKTIKQGSVISWQHINLHGEYDFTAANDAAAYSAFDMQKIRNLTITS